MRARLRELDLGRRAARVGERVRELDLGRRAAGTRARVGELDRRRKAALAAILLLTPAVVLVLALTVGREEGDRPAPAAVEGKPKSFLVDIVPPPKGERRRRAPTGPKVTGVAAKRLRDMPLEQKVAQVFLVGFEGEDLTAPIFARLRRLGLGGIVVGRSNYISSDQIALLSGETRLIAEQERLVTPWVMAEQEGGQFNSFPDLPPATTASLLPDVATAAKEAGAAARTLQPLGVNGVLGPVVDVAPGADSAVGPRAYSDEPDAVAAYAAAVVEAYRSAGVFSAPRHFPGLGSASQSTREGPANVGLSLKELSARDLVPFRAAIEAGAPGVLLSNGLYAPDDFVVPGSLSRTIDTELLRGDLDFKGVAITDDLADPAVTALGPIPDSAVKALAAGADMLYISGSQADQQAAYDAVLSAVQRGDIPSERLDQAVGRVLSAKQDYALLRR